MRTYLLLKRIYSLVYRWSVANPWTALGIYLVGGVIKTVLARRAAREQGALFPILNRLLQAAIGVAMVPLGAGATIGGLGDIEVVLRKIAPAAPRLFPVNVPFVGPLPYYVESAFRWAFR